MDVPRGRQPTGLLCVRRNTGSQGQAAHRMVWTCAEAPPAPAHPRGVGALSLPRSSSNSASITGLNISREKRACKPPGSHQLHIRRSKERCQKYLPEVHRWPRTFRNY